MTVAIVTDTAASLPPDLARANDVVLVPMWITIDGESMHDGEASVDQILHAHVITTSGPTPGEFETAVKEVLAGPADDVLVLTIASTMSSTFEAAVLGARSVGVDVRVVDTRTAAGAQALVVLAAVDAARRGGSLDEVEAAARAAIEEVRLVALVPTLDHLVRSGRVPNIAGWAGRRLGIVPLFEFRDGSAHPLRPARGVPAALDRIVSRWRRDETPGARLHVAALHANELAAAEDLLARVRDAADAPIATSFVAPFGAVMVAHTGPGLVGLAWRWERVSS